jgi:hypothetical protein
VSRWFNSIFSLQHFEKFIRGCYGPAAACHGIGPAFHFGKVTNQSGEALPGATITILNPSKALLPMHPVNIVLSILRQVITQLKASYIGYQPITKNVTLSANQVINF